jgi:hypothetical protein
MAERNLTDADITALSKAIGKQSSPSSTPSSKSLKDIDSAAKGAAESLNPFGGALKTAGGLAADGLRAIKGAVDDGMSTWQGLSKVGAGFNNDIIGMTSAAAGSRLPLADFASVVKDNTANFAGLGGNVTRGAEAFAKMSKGFFESGATDNLKQLGYSSKDLNEILALQAVSVRGIVKDDQERNRVSIEGATRLATEMDSMAKLTGKSREEQQEIMKKQQTDMQFDAAVKLKASAIADPVKRAEFEANAREQYMQAEREGRGQMFKEYYAFGNVISKEAGNQASLMQGQAKATRDAAIISGNTDIDSKDRIRMANEAQERARLAAVADANDKNVLQMRQLGSAGGPVADAYNKQALTMDAYTKAVENAAAKNNLNLKDPEDLKKAQQLANEEVKKTAAGQNEQGKQVDGSTKAMVQFGNSVEHVRAGMIKGLLDPINEKISPQLGIFGDNLKAMNNNFQGKGQIGAVAEKAVKEGVETGTSNKAAGDRKQQPVEEGGVIGAIKTFGVGVGVGVSGADKVVGKVNDAMTGQPPPTPPVKKSFAFGTMGVNGKLFEDFGEGTLAELHGLEAVVRPEDFKNILKSSAGGIGQALGKATADIKMPNVGMPAGGIDLSKISKDISTNISSVTGGKETTVKGPDMKDISMSMAKMGMKEDQKAVFDEMMSLNSKQAKEKLETLKAEKEAAQAANKAATEAIDAIEDKLEAEKTNIKDMSAADKQRYDDLRKQQNESYDAVGKSLSAIKAAEQAEKQRLSLQQLGYEVGVKQEESKATITEATSEKIQAHIKESLPVKDVADKVNETKTVLSDHQKTVLKYAYEDTEGKQMQLDNQKNLIKGELASIEDKNKQIADVQKEADGRELTQREQNRIDRLQKEIESGKETLKIREEELFVYENLDKLKIESTEKTASILEEKNNNEADAELARESRRSIQLPVDTEFGNYDEAVAKNKEDDEAKAELARESRRGQVPSTSKAMQDVVSGSSPTNAQAAGGRKISMDSFTMSKNGMPVFTPKSTASAAPEKKPEEKKASPGKAINSETGEEYTPVGDPKSKDSSKPAANSDSKTATLDDVVKSLNALNTKMGQLIDVNETGHRSTTKAAKSNAANIYQR